MSHPTRVFVFAAALVAATALPALAQQPANMVGTWKGTGYAAHVGPSPYRPADGAGAKLPDNGLEFTYVIKEQKGNRFAGESTAGTVKETIIGAVQMDNRGGIMLDDDGQYAFVMVDPNTMDVCYSHHATANKLVACLRLTRSP